jgi:hypothetical protein
MLASSNRAGYLQGFYMPQNCLTFSMSVDIREYIMKLYIDSTYHNIPIILNANAEACTYSSQLDENGVIELRDYLNVILDNIQAEKDLLNGSHSEQVDN